MLLAYVLSIHQLFIAFEYAGSDKRHRQMHTHSEKQKQKKTLYISYIVPINLCLVPHLQIIIVGNLKIPLLINLLCSFWLTGNLERILILLLLLLPNCQRKHKSCGWQIYRWEANVGDECCKPPWFWCAISDTQIWLRRWKINPKACSAKLCNRQARMALF